MNTKLLKIIVADNDKYVREIITNLLDNSHYNLSYSDTESELLSTIKSNTIDILIMDATFSKSCSIYDFVTNIKNISNKTEIILMYDSSNKIEKNKIEKLPILDVIIKSFEKDKLLILFDRLKIKILSQSQSSNNNNNNNIDVSLKGIYDYVHPHSTINNAFNIGLDKNNLSDGYKYKLKQELESILDVEIKNTIDRYVAEYSKKYLEPTLSEMVPKMAQSILENEIKKIGQDIV